MSKREDGVEPPARALAAGADVQRPGSCEQLDRPSAIDRPAAQITQQENRRLAPVDAPAIFAKTKWPPPRVMLAVDSPRASRRPCTKG